MRSGRLKIKIRVTCFLSIFVLQFAFQIPFLLAQDITWVSVEGRAKIQNISKEEARSQAIEDALRKAVEKVVGANISAQTLIVNLRLSGGIIGAIPYGKVVDKRIIEEGMENVQKEGEDTPSLIYRVKMRASVAEETKGTDPHFKLEASLNQYSFKDGEEMMIRIKPITDCYISIFTIFEDDKVLRLIPNRFKKDNFLKAGEIFSFPDEDDKSKGITLRVHTPEGKDAVRESIYVLAIKKPFKPSDGKFQEGIYGIYNSQTAFMNDLIKEIVNIPLNERAEKLLSYQIRKRK